MTNTKILNKILKDREQRFALRRAMTARDLASVSLNFNIPSFPKSSEDIRKAFELVQRDLQHYFIANRIEMVAEAKVLLHSDCGDFYVQGVRYSCEDTQLKNLLENFEQSHPLGRLLDVDLMTRTGEMVSSGKAKKCFLCEKPAKECMKEQRHEFAEYQVFVAEQIADFLAERKQKLVISQLMELALKATLFEVSVENKPGLVCPSSNGSHTDMDYFTFLSSSASLANYWQEMATFGYGVGKEKNVDYKEVRLQLRLFGLTAEEQMLNVTNGVNTQKGVIFLLGLGCFAGAFTFAQEDKFDVQTFRGCLQKLMKDIVSEDLEKAKSQQGTHGEIVFKKYGKNLAGGARQEAENAFPTVFELALPYLQERIGKKQEFLKKDDWQEILLDLLMLIISKSNDVNILYRKNAEVLAEVQNKAERVFSTENKEKAEELKAFSDYCMLHNISSGGSADLLGLSLFVFFIHNLKF